MRLEIGSFPVTDVTFGPRTTLRDGVLELNRREIEELVFTDRNIARLDIQIARPGESARIINMRDCLEPRVKVQGPGVVYPAVFGRPVERVGEGVTYRLGGVNVVQCADQAKLTSEEERRWPPLRPIYYFVDMIGPGAITPSSSVINVCLTMETRPGLSGEDWHAALSSALLRVSDRLAETVKGLTPLQSEVFDLSPKRGLPRVVSIFNLASDEWFCGARSVLGTSIYGQTRLSAPWLLSATELMDGAVYHSAHSGNTATMINNPVVLQLARQHGKECDYAGVLIQRTNWTTQAEKEMATDRLVHLAVSLGAQGAVLTTDIRGQRFVETILGVRACERAGIKTVLLTPEEDDEDGMAPPLLISASEVVSVVSTGTGGQEDPFPAVERVIGAFDIDPQYYRPQPPIHGRYGQSYFNDIYGGGRQGRVDY